MDARFLTQWIRAGEQSWGSFILESMVKKKVPDYFPLSESPGRLAARATGADRLAALAKGAVSRPAASGVAAAVDSGWPSADDWRMSEIIYPRSPREVMCGWMHLPRFIDKIRLHLAGKLHPDYQPNLCKGFDGLWLETAGVEAKQFIEVVRNSLTDGEVCDWVRKNVKQPDSVKAAHRDRMLNYPRKDDAEMQARLKMRKEQAGLAQRDDIQSFVDFIDADEKRI